MHSAADVAQVKLVGTASEDASVYIGVTSSGLALELEEALFVDSPAKLS